MVRGTCLTPHMQGFGSLLAQARSLDIASFLAAGTLDVFWMDRNGLTPHFSYQSQEGPTPRHAGDQYAGDRVRHDLARMPLP